MALPTTPLPNELFPPTRPTLRWDAGIGAWVRYVATLAAVGYADIVAEAGVPTDGSRTVTAEINAAIVAAAADKRDILVRGGLFDLGDGELVIPAGLSVHCSKDAEFRRSANPAVARPVISLASRTRWIGGRVVSTVTTPQASALNCAILASGVTDVTVQGVEVAGRHYVGIELDRAIEARALHNRVAGVVNRSIYVYRACDDVVIDGNDCSGFEVGGGVRYTSYAINVNPALDGFATNIRVVNNGCENFVVQGIEFGDRTAQALIANNTVEGVDFYGILVQLANGFAPTDVTIQGNTASSCGHYGIRIVSSPYVTINDSICLVNGGAISSGAGIGLISSQFAGVKGNLCRANTGSGLRLDLACDRPDVVGNRFVLNSRFGIEAPNSPYGMISAGNQLHGNSLGAEDAGALAASARQAGLNNAL